MTINFKNQTLEFVSITLSSSDRALNKSQERWLWETFTAPDSFPLQSYPLLVTSIPHVRHLHFQQIHTTVSGSPPMAGVNECACLSALIVNETLTQIQHRQIFTAQPGGFITDKSVILQEVLHFFICHDRA